MYTKPDVIVSFRLSHWTLRMRKNSLRWLKKKRRRCNLCDINRYLKKVFGKNRLPISFEKPIFQGFIAITLDQSGQSVSKCEIVNDDFGINWNGIYRCSFEIGTNVIYHFTLYAHCWWFDTFRNQTIHFKVFSHSKEDNEEKKKNNGDFIHDLFLCQQYYTYSWKWIRNFLV